MLVMKRARNVSLAVALVGLWAPGAHAAARVFASVNGNDANNCASVATPCRTLDAAVNQVDAEGEVIVLDTGSYAGATITKSVKINVPSGVVAFSASTVTVAAGASDVVVVRGLTIKALTPGTGNGIAFSGGASLYVENCVIDGWATGINFGSAGQLYVKDTTVRNSSQSGLFATAASGTASASVDLSRFERNGGCGVRAGSGARIAARDSVASGNGNGFCADANGQVSVLNSQASNNTTAGVAASGAGAVARVANSTVTNNGTGFSNAGGATFQSLGTSLVRGNTADTSGTITTVSGN
jgi:hypothetical protein